MEHRFEPPFTIIWGDGSQLVGTVEAAAELLADVDWPGERGDLHREALETCLKVIDGHRSTEDARMAFGRLIDEAGLGADSGRR